MVLVRMLARAELRRRGRGWVALGLLVGLIFGGVLAAAAGARRTASAYPRFLVATRAFDAYVFTRGGRSQAAVDPARVLAEPQVAGGAVLVGFAVTEQDVALAVNPDGQLGSSVDRYKLLAGRNPRPDRPDEALVGFATAEHRHLSVGSPLVVHITAQRPDGTFGTPVPVTFRVVGIEAGPGEFPTEESSSFEPVVLSPAFLATPLGAQAATFGAALVRLRRGPSDVAAFAAAVQRLSGDTPLSVVPLAPNSAVIERSFRLQADALWVVAGVALLVGLAIAGQLLARQLALGSEDHLGLRAVGASTPQLVAKGLAASALTALVATLSSVLGAELASPLAPIGLARVAEPHPGIAIDAAVLGIGGIGTFLALMALSAIAAWRVVRRSAGPGVPVWAGRVPVTPVLGSLGLPPSAAAGLGFALYPGRGIARVPVRSGIGAVAVGTGALAAALTFSASTAYLLATPRLYGVTFDAQVLGDSVAGMGAALPAIRADPDVQGAALVLIQTPLTVDGVDIEGADLAAVRGTLWPPLVRGRDPAAPDEVLLGGDTLRAVHAKVGDRVLLGVRNFSPAPRSVTVVGQAVMPPFSDREQLGKGVTMMLEEIDALIPARTRPHVPLPDHVLVRFRPGTSAPGARARLAAAVAPAGSFTVAAAAQPADLVNFGGVRGLPLVLAGLMAALAAGTLAHVLTSAVRRRGRDLAILKALGFVPRQVGGVLRWQALALSCPGLALGMLLGAAAGRWAWEVAASGLGVTAVARAPALAMAATAAGTVVLTLALAAFPGARAARLPVAPTLRAD